MLWYLGTAEIGEPGTHSIGVDISALYDQHHRPGAADLALRAIGK